MTNDEADLRDAIRDDILRDPFRHNALGDMAIIDNAGDRGTEVDVQLVAWDIQTRDSFRVTPAITITDPNEVRRAVPLTPREAFNMGAELVRMALALNDDERTAKDYHREIQTLERLADLRAIGSEWKRR